MGLTRPLYAAIPIHRRSVIRLAERLGGARLGVKMAGKECRPVVLVEWTNADA